MSGEVKIKKALEEYWIIWIFRMIDNYGSFHETEITKIRCRDNELKRRIRELRIDKEIYHNGYMYEYVCREGFVADDGPEGMNGGKKDHTLVRVFTPLDFSEESDVCIVPKKIRCLPEKLDSGIEKLTAEQKHRRNVKGRAPRKKLAEVLVLNRGRVVRRVKPCREDEL